jgi:hypothetical protein
MDTLDMFTPCGVLDLRPSACGNRIAGPGTPPQVTMDVGIRLRKNAALYTIFG